MKIAIPREVLANETRVAATPTTVQRYRKLGIDVCVQAGAGDGANFTDADYIEAGAEIVADPVALWAGADVVLKVRPPTKHPTLEKYESELLREGAWLVGFIWPAVNAPVVQLLGARKATVLAMDCVPRITRAQKLDALSAMANVAGYRAIIEAVSVYGRFIPGQMTAAGRSKPAQVLIVGAGVAGLAAIAAARSLGAVVRAFDTRPAVREQVESLGAQFLEFKFEESGEGEGGYAKQMSEAYLVAEQTMIAQHIKDADIVVTTALVPGTTAPQLVTSGAVVSMRHGSVIVDLAAEQGGNCALTEPDKIVERFGVTIIGLTNLTSRMALQSSELYATTVYNLIESVWKADEKKLAIDHDDEIERGVLILENGEMRWPPPKRERPRSGAPRPEAPVAKKPAPKKEQSAGGKWLAGALLVAFGVVGTLGPTDLMQHLTVFIMACIVGWHVVWNVTPALHTPLMSVTNAISGIILVGGMLLVTGINGVTVLGVVAVLLASINAVGGFRVTQRMLRMFRK